MNQTAYMKTFFKELFEYSHHFNQKLVRTLVENADQVPERSLELFHHIINAQQIWNCRIERGPSEFGVWEIHKFKSLHDLDTANFEKSLELLAKYDLDAVIEYSNSRGILFQNMVRDILFHIVNHSTYHRGQIIANMSGKGVAVFSSDYIFYKR